MIYDEDDIIEIPTIGSVKAGDTVMVALRNGEPTAIGVVGDGDEKNALIDAAKEAADEAKAVSEATGQHFFADDSGAHVTETENDPTTGHNILINSLGILLRKAIAPLVSITQSAIAFYDGDGNEDSNVVASFGKSGAHIGRIADGEIHAEITNGAFRIVRGLSQLVGNFGYKARVEEADDDGDGAITYYSPYLGIDGNIECSNVYAGKYIVQESSGGQCQQYRKRTDLNTRYGRTAPTETKYVNSEYVRDSNNETVAQDQTYLTADGELIRLIGVRRHNSSGASYVQNALSLRVTNDGKRRVVVSESAPWRNALGFGETLSDAFSAISHAAMIYGHGTSQTLTTSGTAYKVNLTSISKHDPNGLFELSSNGIKIKKGGRYLLCGQAYFQSVSSGGYIQVEIHENDAVIPQSVSFVRINGATSTANTGMLVKTVTEGDTLYLYALSSTAKAVLPATSSGFYLTAIYLG